MTDKNSILDERKLELSEIQIHWNDVLKYTEAELDADDEKFAEKAELQIWAEKRGFKLNEDTNLWEDARGG